MLHAGQQDEIIIEVLERGGKPGLFGGAGAGKTAKDQRVVPVMTVAEVRTG